MAILQRQHILHLTLLEGVGPAAIMRIVAAAERDFFVGSGGIYDARELDFVRLGFSSALAQKIVSGLRDAVTLEKELTLIQRYAISWATIFEPEYPALLKHIHLPPSVLYWQGDLASQSSGASDRSSQENSKAPTFALVGSRNANWYGKQAIDLFVSPLVAQGCVIVSGGALGADSMAHAATIQAGGKTIAVLGSGLLDPYPASNTFLFSQITQNGGAVVSPFPLLMHASPGSFPARNRVIAGMSSGCIVVQAAVKSGALITARFALEQGRDVFAVPGPIEDPVSAGCHALIKEGAHLVTCAADVLGEYAQLLAPMRGAVSERTAQASLFGQGTLTGELSIQEQKKSHRIAREFQGVEGAGSSMQNHEQAESAIDVRTPQGHIMHCCTTPQSLDDLAAQTGLTFAQLYELLFELQMQGVLAQNAVGMWQRSR
ncbi:DNA-protecting protein DprA [Candidatus Dependentiae bacterium HGW-Dependentiae-1]|nr:MAG: DNA-protecting protein DprA [Candidatus Dependentiae bacterium HGW-Dependentiae-1]